MTSGARAEAPDDLDAWLRLLASPGVGRGSARRLLASFASPQAVFDAPHSAHRAVVGEAAAAGLRALPPGHDARLAATRVWLAGGSDRSLMVLGDPDYPALLLHTADPPLLLYLWGRRGLMNAPSVAVVGSRTPTAQGRDNARSFAAALVRHGWTVVSGLARGIDGAAHEGALQAGAGAVADAADGAGTIAVIGTGIDGVYPLAHRGLSQRIAARGLLVSELPLGSVPLPAHFPQRNRLIAGLSRGTLVVEAAERSGSLITARLAAEAGREVMVIPGSILARQSQGGHGLIRQGAALVASVEQVLEELGPPLAAPPPGATRAGEPSTGLFAPAATSGLDEPADPVLRALGGDPCSLDALIARCGWPGHQLLAHLLALELAGQVACLPGGLYQRVQAV